jgi:hypothetical protein
MKFLKWGMSTFWVALFYIIGVLIFNETHPFSRFPMYSSFPNWSYSFYLTNKTDEIIPFSNLETDGEAVGHLYGSVSQELDILYGDFMESEVELQKIGNRMMNILLESRGNLVGEYKLYRKAFYYKNDSIHEQIVLMTSYENY